MNKKRTVVLSIIVGMLLLGTIITNSAFAVDVTDKVAEEIRGSDEMLRSRSESNTAILTILTILVVAVIALIIFLVKVLRIFEKSVQKKGV